MKHSLFPSHTPESLFPIRILVTGVHFRTNPMHSVSSSNTDLRKVKKDSLCITAEMLTVFFSFPGNITIDDIEV